MTYGWTTEKGAKVELTVNTVVKPITESYYCDGDRTEITKNVKTTTYNISVNGTAYNASLTSVNGKTAIGFMVGNKQAAVFIPQNIEDEIFAPTEAEKEMAKFFAQRKAFDRMMDNE